LLGIEGLCGTFECDESLGALSYLTNLRTLELSALDWRVDRGMMEECPALPALPSSL
jgi:hypothetical protein